MFSADPACEIGFVEQLEKNPEVAERRRKDAEKVVLPQSHRGHEVSD
jgi:hypothetical protein